MASDNAKSDECRKKFEAWAEDKGYSINKYASGYYGNTIVQAMWVSWQACEALSGNE